MKALFNELFEYTHHFNEMVIDSLLKHDIIPEKVLQLINHTINAQEIWNNRIEESINIIDVWAVRPLNSLKEINTGNYTKTLEIIEKSDLEKKVRYSNTQGKAFENSIRDILFHVINHSTYHRGQIATYCKLDGLTPLVTDYIFYKRESL
jgi:uncharacterized damage-inducible protein DinB